MNNLKQTLSEALGMLGCDPSRFSFDDRSAIAMSFNDVGDIMLDPVGDQLWMWCALTDVRLDTLRPCAHDLLVQIATPVDYMAAGCLSLRADDDQVRVGGLVRMDYVDEARHFAAAIEGFYLRMVLLQELAK
jgi:hypothetical protein